MSPQSSLLVAQQPRLSDIVQAADAAYQSKTDDSHKPLDMDTRYQDDACRPLSAVPVTGGPRFNLRKRKVSLSAEPQEQDTPAMSSPYSSDFLSGIFADIKAAASSSEEEEEEEHYVTSDEGDSCPNTPVHHPRKKFRSSKSLGRCSKSYVSLACFQAPPGSKNPNPSTQLSTDSYAHDAAGDLAKNLFAAAEMAFPHLPATVSDSFTSSAADLTQPPPGQHAPETETNTAATADLKAADGEQITANDDPKSDESYGWFLSLDDAGRDAADAYENATPKGGDLTFQAPAATDGVDHDADVQWAKAADTVDDVLGDFF